MTAKPIKFECELRQVKTMADHSVNLTLNLPEYHSGAAAELIRYIGQMAQAVLVVDGD